MEWIRQGKIFSPDGSHPWMQHYAAQACAIEFQDFLRIYFSTRSKADDNGNFQTSITFIDCDKSNPTNIIYKHNKSLLLMGRPGTFDEHGTMMCEIFFHEDKYWLYYLGWQRSGTVPYITTLGLAMSENGVDFTKISEGPIIGLSRHIPYGIAKISILIENSQFNMWYTHYTPWVKHGPKKQATYRPGYDIRFATSANGIDWEFADICLPAGANEALGTPCVRKIDGVYHMWFGHRQELDENGKSGKYTIGYAVSSNKTDWTRRDDPLLLPALSDEWDADMKCYPYVFNLANKWIMLYSGNGYGRDGFGYAITKSLSKKCE